MSPVHVVSAWMLNVPASGTTRLVLGSIPNNHWNHKASFSLNVRRTLCHGTNIQRYALRPLGISQDSPQTSTNAPSVLLFTIRRTWPSRTLTLPMARFIGVSALIEMLWAVCLVQNTVFGLRCAMGMLFMVVARDCTCMQPRLTARIRDGRQCWIHCMEINTKTAAIKVPDSM